MKMTIRKLAALTGVSRGTVDKVLHHRPGVSEEVRQRVRAEIEARGYQLVPRAQESAESRRPRRIAVVIPGQENPFFNRVKQGVEDALLRYHEEEIRLDFFYCDGTRVGEILTILDRIEEQAVDGILLRGIQSQRLRERLDALAQKEIPVVLLDSDVPGAKRLCMVGEDSKTSGRVAASLLAKSIGGEGEVAILNGHPDMAVHSARQQGFEEAMREHFPKVRIVETMYCREQRALAYEQTNKLLDKYPRLRGIFSVVGCTGDIGQALSHRNSREMKIVSYNFTADVIALVKRGVVDFTIGLTPYRQGATALTTLLQFLLYREKPGAVFLEMPLLIGIDENIDVLSKNQDI